MSSKILSSKYGLIGENLELKKNIKLEISEKGKILKITCDKVRKNVEFSPNNENFLMMPGFINSHIHIGDSFAKEMGFNMDLIEVVSPPHGLKHEQLRKAPNDVKMKGMRNAALEMLSNGITFFVDFREGGIEGIELVKEALKDSPIGYLLLGRFSDKDEFESVMEIADGIGFSSYKNVPPEIMEKLITIIGNNSKLIACHGGEYTRDGNLFNIMIRDGIIDIVVHGTQYISEDLETLKKRDISLVLCPRSNGYFGVGFPPINEIIKQKMPICIGTDNLMVNNADLFEEMRYLYRISRVLSKNNNEIVLTAKDLLKMVTINAATCFNKKNELGSISEGKFADLFLIDLNDPNFYSYNIKPETILLLIVNKTKSENVKKIYIKGELVFERN